MTNNRTKIDPQTDLNRAPGPFSFAHIIGIICNTIGVIWSVHVLIAALFYPRFLLPGDNLQDAKNDQKRKLYKGLSLFFGTLILFINIFSLVALFTRPTLIDAAKVLFVFFIWLLVGLIYIVFNHLRGIYDVLTILEDEAIQSRDQSVMLIRAGQAALQAGSRKLQWQENDENLSFVNLLKKYAL